MDNLIKDLKNQYVGHRALLATLCVVNESDRKSPTYQDPKHFPFYYHLGKYVQPINMLEIGFGLGLYGSCFLKSCKTVKKYLAFQRFNDEYYSPRLAIRNIKFNYDEKLDFYIGKLDDKNFIDKIDNFDIILFNENLNYNTLRYEVDLIWNYLNDDGIIVINYYDNEDVKKAIKDISKIKNRDFEKYNTRYGTAIIRK